MVGAHSEQLNFALLRRFKSASSSRSGILLFPVLILVGVFGCAPLVVPIDVSAPIELAPSEALLIIHIDTEVALERLRLNSHPLVQSLGKGRHAWIVRVREGSYRWRKIEIGSNLRNRLKYDLGSDEELSFNVVAGKINYPGELVIRSSPGARWGNKSVIVRNRNHSAMAIREIRMIPFCARSRSTTRAPVAMAFGNTIRASVCEVTLSRIETQTEVAWKHKWKRLEAVA